MDQKSMILGIIIGAAGMLVGIHLLWKLGFMLIHCILGILRRGADSADQIPASHSSMEGMVLPMVRKDFPDFDLPGLKQQAESYIKAAYADKENLRINTVSLRDYRKDSDSCRLLLEASLSWQEKKAVYKHLEISAKRAKDEHTWQLSGL